MLTNREVATLIIVGTFLAFAFFRAEVRKSFADILKTFCSKPILSVIAFYLCYAGLLLWLAWAKGWWDTSLLKDTFVMVLLIGMGMVFSAHTNRRSSDITRKTLKDTLGLSAFLAFYVNLSSFNILAEIVIQLILICTVVMLAIAPHRQETPKSTIIFFRRS